MTKKNSRIDKYILEKLNKEREENLSRSQIQNLLKKGQILVNQEIVKANYKLKETDEIEFKKNWESLINQEIKISEEDFKFEIVYENEDFIVINKPSGIVVHPDNAGNNQENTVVNALLSKIDLKNFKNQENIRPGIVHRLDKETSGLLILTKNQKAQDFFIDEFKNRRIEKEYTTLVKGKLQYEKGVIDSPIGRDPNDRKKMAIVNKTTGKEAITKYKVSKEYKLPFVSQSEQKKTVSLLKIKIETGRTHQIRVHLSAINHPVIGDQVYGNRPTNKYFETEYGLERQFLHASKLKIKTPQGEELTLKADLPKDLETILISLQ